MFELVGMKMMGAAILAGANSLPDWEEDGLEFDFSFPITILQARSHQMISLSQDAASPA
jgi:hypothetical protein